MEKESVLKRIFKSKLIVLILILLAIIIMYDLINPNYLSRDNLRGIMHAMSVTGIMAVGTSCLFIGGGIDLASSTEGLLAGVLVALMLRSGVPWPLAIIIALIVGAVVGLAIAGLVAHLRMMPFIATIAVSNVVLGFNRMFTNSQNVPIPNESFWVLGGSNLFGVIPMPFIIMLVLLFIYGLMLKYTQFGRNIYLVGGNMNAARLSGLNPLKIKSILYVNNAILASFSGVIVVSRMHSASPASSSDAQMSAITAAILGGVSFAGGAGTMMGCFIGILLLTFFNNGLNILSLESYWQTIAQGAILIIALAMDFFSTRAREKSLKVKIDIKKEGAAA